MAPTRRPEAPPGITIRVALEEDVGALADMVNDFVRGHPAENHSRPEQALPAAYFSATPVAEIIVAELNGNLVGMLQWTRTFDMFWSMFGGLIEWLYVKPHARGLGLSAAMLAMACRRVRDANGEFLLGTGGEHLTSLYSRLASAAGATQEYRLSGEGFQQAADLAGAQPRYVVRHFPSPALSSVPARSRPERE
jgi:GNAT superfamily N-acetyltransferase